MLEVNYSAALNFLKSRWRLVPFPPKIFTSTLFFSPILGGAGAGLKRMIALAEKGGKVNSLWLSQSFSPEFFTYTFYFSSKLSGVGAGKKRTVALTNRKGKTKKNQANSEQKTSVHFTLRNFDRHWAFCP
ncbi:MAG: hypothetical protein NUV58_01385 [Candidatus Roizmanbacteria bacterium]|nr:hypothetical protein [Candidatus Roizmanbacteria bacterium]